MTKKEIYNILASSPNVIKQNECQLRTKCFLCGDSKKNPNKKRLGIKIDIHNPDEPILYQCFNCFQKGIFTVDMLHQMEIYDKELEISIRSINGKALHDNGTKVNRYRNRKEIPVEFPSLKERDIPKVKYLYDRLQYKIPMEDFNKLKIVFNLQDFLDTNDIRPVNNYVPVLSSDYIGFLSVNNEYVLLRDITNSHKMRWVKYNLFNVFDNTNSFYVIKNGLDLLDTEDIHFSVAEGPLDILGLHYLVFKGNNHNNIEIATCNGSMTNPILYYFKKGLVGSNIHLDLYQDNDTRLNFKNVRNQLKPYIINGNNFNVYYNRLSKDFGVPLSEIEVDKLQI